MKDIDIKKIVDQTVDEMFRGSSTNILNEADTVYTTRAKKDLVNAFQNYYNKNKAHVGNMANNLGVNLDKGVARDNYEREMLDKHGSYEEALKQMSPEMRSAIDAMKKVRDPKTSREEKLGLYKKFGGANFQRYRDILDKLSLTPTYDQKRAKAAGINKAPFNTEYELSGGGTSKTKKDGISGYSYQNLDLTAVPENEILKYFRDGTRANHNLDENPNNPTYRELSLMAKNGDENAKNVLKNLYFKAEFNKVMNSKFGYDFKIPGAMYTYGNSKLPKDTLVINFTTAHRCPAWNECLVGYACYARGSEHNYEGLHKKNSNLHLMWQSAMDDPELMIAMKKVIKTYLVNPQEMAMTLLNNEKTRNKWIEKLSNGEIASNKINKATNKRMEMPDNPVLGITGDKEDEGLPGIGESRSILGMVLEDMEMAEPKKISKPKGANASLGSYIYDSNWAVIFSKDDVEAIKANPKVFRARFIRLNEEGDFIGQWLLDAFDEFAGELKLLGISTAAYTCRNLNFSNIKNIILNASTLKVGTKGETSGNVSNAIARRFFAVSKELYNSLEDTYMPNNRDLNYIPNKNGKKGWDGSNALIPLHSDGENWKVKYAPKPYTLDGNTAPVEFNDKYDPNGETIKQRLYYKCPCGRYGDVLKNGKPLKMDCYLCRMCYEPKNQNLGEIYVLVAVHGDNTDSFNAGKANSERGIKDTMATYKEAREIFGNRLSEATQMSEKEGMRIVSENGISSVKAHLANIADSEAMSIRNESSSFSDMMNRMKIVENKRKKNIID